MKIDDFMKELNSLHSSLQESVKDGKSLTEKWRAVENYIADVNSMKKYMQMCSKKN